MRIEQAGMDRSKGFVTTTCGTVNSAWGDLREYRKILQYIGWLAPEKAGG